MKHFVFVSSMGGTQDDNFLNTIGRQKDGTGGDILRWKRKAEKYLVKSGLPHTILHPGGLVDEAPGLREIVLGVDDALMASDPAGRTVSRADVARLCCEAAMAGSAESGEAMVSSLVADVVSRPLGQGRPVNTAGRTGARKLLDSARAAAAGGKAYDYSIGSSGDPPSLFSAARGK